MLPSYGTVRSLLLQSLVQSLVEDGAHTVEMVARGAARVPTRIKIGLHTLAPSSNVAFLHDNSIKAFN